GGVFYWDTDKTTHDDGGTVIVPDGSWAGTLPASAPWGIVAAYSAAATQPRTGCWKRLCEGPMNVRWFGAKGDASTTDDLAFRLAIQSLPMPAGVFGYTRGPGLYVPPGIFALAQTIVVDRTIRLFGASGGGWKLTVEVERRPHWRRRWLHADLW